MSKRALLETLDQATELWLANQPERFTVMESDFTDILEEIRTQVSESFGRLPKSLENSDGKVLAYPDYDDGGLPWYFEVRDVTEYDSALEPVIEIWMQSRGIDHDMFKCATFHEFVQADAVCVFLANMAVWG